MFRVFFLISGFLNRSSIVALETPSLLGVIVIVRVQKVASRYIDVYGWVPRRGNCPVEGRCKVRKIGKTHTYNVFTKTYGVGPVDNRPTTD